MLLSTDVQSDYRYKQDVSRRKIPGFQPGANPVTVIIYWNLLVFRLPAETLEQRHSLRPLHALLPVIVDNFYNTDVGTRYEPYKSKEYKEQIFI